MSNNFGDELIQFFNDNGSVAGCFFQGGILDNQELSIILAQLEDDCYADVETEIKDAFSIIVNHLKEQQEGGNKDGTYANVYMFTKGNEKVIIKFDGTYTEYHGAEYDSCYIVQAKEKTITVYE